jgi:hypothetical protein
MDGSTLLALPTFPPASGLQIFALFVNFFFPGLALLVVSVRVAGRVAANQFAVDDWLVCIAMLMSIAETVISFFCTPAHAHLLRCDETLTDKEQSSRPTSSAFHRTRCRLTTLPRA